MGYSLYLLEPLCSYVRGDEYIGKRDMTGTLS